MDHVQIPIEVTDANWRERCDEKMERLKNAQISTSQQTRVLQEQLSFEKKHMILELSTFVEDKNADSFVDKLEEISAKRKLSLGNILDQVTHAGDSLLHVAAHFGAEEIGELIAHHFPELLMKKNNKGDTPLYVAARAKNPNVVKMILSQYAAVKAKLLGESERVNSPENEDNELTRLRNEYGNTPLHVAVYTNHFETVSLLFEKDKPVAHHLNMSGKSALYIAVLNSNSNREIIDLLLQASFVDKPLPKHHGISPLHAAISKMDSALLAYILEKNQELIYLRDEYGGTVLHYAASINYLAGIQTLLKKCSLLALECNTKGHLPVHIACKMDHVEIVKELLKQAPNARDFLNQKGQNILHVAAKGGKHKVVKYLLEEARLEDFTINEIDRNGNTALHLATKQFYPNVLVHLVEDKRVDLNIKNNDDCTACDLIALYRTMPIMTDRELLAHKILVCAGSKESEKARSIYRGRNRKTLPKVDQLNNRVNTFMLIGILIATVTFAAGFTVPGGVYSSDDPNPERRGSAVLGNKVEFQIFTVCNSIAMFGSTFGCLILFRAFQPLDYQVAFQFYMLGVALVTIALWAMYLAFVTATLLVASSVPWLANFIAVIASILFLSHHVLNLLVNLPALHPRTYRRWPHLLYFLLRWIHIPCYGEFDEKITTKHEDTNCKRVNMDKVKKDL